jgi:uncharacterized protein YybS (DUF2232 family)
MQSFLRQARGSAVAALISFALYFSGLLIMLTPLPILYAWVARGRLAGAAAAAVSLAAIAAAYLFLLQAVGGEGLPYMLIPGQGLAGELPLHFIRVAGIGYFAFYVAMAVALAEGARRRWEVGRWGLVTLAASVAVLLAIALYAALTGFAQVVEGLRSYALLVINEVIKANEAAGAASQASFLAGRAEAAASFFVGIMPALAFVFTAIAVAVNMAVGRRLIRAHHAFSHVHNMARFRLPDWFIWGVIAAGCAFFADQYLVHAGWPGTVAMNCLICLAALYFFQGMAVVVYFLQGVRFPLFRTLAYVAMIFFLQAVGPALMAVGIVDVWVNFRLRRWKSLHHHSDT